MADKAHRLTDEKLEEMEKRLSAIYSRAEKEIQKTADEYFSKFAKQDEAKRKLLEQGKITEEEYKKWRKGKVKCGTLPSLSLWRLLERNEVNRFVYS